MDLVAQQPPVSEPAEQRRLVDHLSAPPAPRIVLPLQPPLLGTLRRTLRRILTDHIGKAGK